MSPLGEPGREPFDAGGDPRDDGRSLRGYNQHVERTASGDVGNCFMARWQLDEP
jgi:hypothetical protein